MAFCPNCCSNDATSSRQTIDASEFGLPSGLIHGVMVIDCPECEEQSLSIGAHGAVMKEYRRQLASVARPLNGEEFAYLRRALGVSGRGYAEVMGISNVTVSRLEHGDSVPAIQDKLIRTITLLDLISPDAIAQLIGWNSNLVEVDASAVERRKPMDLTDGWQPLPSSDQRRVSNVIPIRSSRIIGDAIDVVEYETDQDQELSDVCVRKLACR